MKYIKHFESSRWFSVKPCPNQKIPFVPSAKMNQLRLAEDWEIEEYEMKQDANKYNL